jgi:hypothetical protein
LAAVINSNQDLKDIVENESSITFSLAGDGRGNRMKSTNIGLFFIHPSYNSQSLLSFIPLAILSGSDTYETLASAKLLWDQLEELQGSPLEVHRDRSVQVNITLTSDLKFMNLITGMQSCMAKKCCIWCTCSKEEYSQNKQLNLSMSRKATEDISENGRARRNLVSFISTENCVPDILHLEMRIWEKLMRSLLELVWTSCKPKKNSVEELAVQVRKATNCSQFVVYEADTHSKCNMEWASVQGPSLRLLRDVNFVELVKELKFSDVSTGDKIQKAAEVFLCVFDQ